MFTVDADTLPQNTLDPINAIVNPQLKGPGTTAGLPAAVSGQRYLFVNDTGSQSTTNPGFSQAWRGTDGTVLVADTNDIVQYDGTKWNVVFNAGDNTSGIVQYVTNLTTSVQYRWADSQWLKSYEGLYTEGSWSIVL